MRPAANKAVLSHKPGDSRLSMPQCRYGQQGGGGQRDQPRRAKSESGHGLSVAGSGEHRSSGSRNQYARLRARMLRMLDPLVAIGSWLW